MRTKILCALSLSLVVSTMGGCPTGGSPTNSAPVASAGSDQSVAPGASVVLSGSATDADGDPLAYHWTQLSGPAASLSGSNAASASFVAPASAAGQTLVFELEVIDPQGASDDDTVNVAISAGGGAGGGSGGSGSNTDPTVSAGADQAVEAGDAVAMTATASDADGDALTYAWAQIAGTAVTLSGAATAGASFTAPDVSGTLTFQVTVSDGQGGSASDSISIDVHASPILFIANYVGQNVTAYVDPATVNGNIAPDLNLQGGSTQLSGPADIVVNSAEELVVANYVSDAITTYADADALNGNIMPARNVAGAATTVTDPSSLAIDTASDLVFVADMIHDDIKVFANVSQSSFVGNLPPTRVIRTTTSGDIVSPLGVNLDSSGSLYVANSGLANILVFENAGALNGDLTPTRIISSPDFVGALLYDVFIDLDDRMYVVDGLGRVLIFQDASTLNGSTPADVILTGTVPAPLFTAIAVDSSQTGYLVDYAHNAVYVYDMIHTRNGAIPPDRTIQGAATQLVGPIRVYLMER